jgi:hypothetical protein
LYVAPGSVLPVGRWDYTNPEAVDLAVTLGERDADAFEPQLRQLLDESWPAGRGDAVADQATSASVAPPG